MILRTCLIASVLAIGISASGQGPLCAVEFSIPEKVEVLRLYVERYKLINDQAPRALIVKVEGDIRILEEKLKSRGLAISKEEILEKMREAKEQKTALDSQQDKAKVMEADLIEKAKEFDFNNPVTVQKDSGLVHRFFPTRNPDLVLVLRGQSQGIEVLSLSQKRVVRTIDINQSIFCMALAADGLTLALGLARGDVFIYSLQSGQVTARWKADKKAIEGIEFGPEGRVLTVAKDQTVRAWDISTREEVQSYKSEGFFFNAHKNGLRGITLDPSKRFILGYGIDGNISVWDYQTSKLVHSFLVTKESAILDLKFIPNSNKAFVNILQGGAAIVDWKLGRVDKVLGQGPGFFRGLEVAASGKQIFYAFRNTLYAYLLDTEQEIALHTLARGEFLEGVILPDKISYLGASYEGEIVLFKGQ